MGRRIAGEEEHPFPATERRNGRFGRPEPQCGPGPWTVCALLPKPVSFNPGLAKSSLLEEGLGRLGLLLSSNFVRDPLGKRPHLPGGQRMDDPRLRMSESAMWKPGALLVFPVTRLTRARHERVSQVGSVDLLRGTPSEDGTSPHPYQPPRSFWEERDFSVYEEPALLRRKCTVTLAGVLARRAQRDSWRSKKMRHERSGTVQCRSIAITSSMMTPVLLRFRHRIRTREGKGPRN